MSSQVLQENQPPKVFPVQEKNLQSARNPAHRIFKFLASLQLAIGVLVTLMAVLAAGTILESLYGTETARLVIYESSWFSLILIVLGVNLAAAALDRLPWKRKHVGFVITHAGIILILVGSLVTQRSMIDGQMPVAEGSSEHRISLEDPLLYVASGKTGRDLIFPLKKHAFEWHGRDEIKSSFLGGLPLKIRLTADYPKARAREKIGAAASGPAAVKVTLHNSFVNETQWLVENDASMGNVQLGPAKVRFTDEFLKESSSTAAEQGYLEFEFGSQRITLPLAADLKPDTPLPLEGTPYQVKIVKIFKNAFVAGKELEEIDPAKMTGQVPESNPAVQLLLENKNDASSQERHTVFAKFPDFPTMHGMKPAQSGARIFYRLPHSGSKGETHELRFIQKDGKLFYQVQTGLDVKTGNPVEGEEIPTGWMDLKFRADEFYPHSEKEIVLSPQPNNSESEGVAPALELEAEEAGERKTVSLSQGVSQSVEIAGSRYDFLYGQKRIPAPFQIMLRDFKMEKYPGTDQPASFESNVVLKDAARGVYREATISMNKPLVYRGFRIYQSGYSLNEGEPEVSVFSVGKDSGVPLKYLGAIVMVGGVITMFYTRKFSSTSGLKL